MLSLPTILPLETIVYDPKDSRISKVHGSCPIERLWDERSADRFGFLEPDSDLPIPDGRIANRSSLSMGKCRVFRQVCAKVCEEVSIDFPGPEIQISSSQTPNDFFLDSSAKHIISSADCLFRRSKFDATWLGVTIPIEPVFRTLQDEFCSRPPPLPLSVELFCGVEAERGTGIVGYEIKLDAMANERVGIDILAVYDGCRRQRPRLPGSDENPNVVFVGYFEIGCTHGKDDPRKSVKFNLPPSPLGRLLELRLRPFRIATVHLQGYYADQPEPQLRRSVRPSEASFDVESSSFGAPYLLFTETRKLNIQDIAIPGEKIVICRPARLAGRVGINRVQPMREFGYLYGTKTFHIPLQFDFLLRFDVPVTGSPSRRWLDIQNLKLVLARSVGARCLGVEGIEPSAKLDIVDCSEIVDVHVERKDRAALFVLLDYVNRFLLEYSRDSGRSFVFPTTSTSDSEEIDIRSRLIATVSCSLADILLMPNWRDLIRSYDLFRRGFQFLYYLAYLILEKSALLVRKNPGRVAFRNIAEIYRELQRLRRGDAPETSEARQREIGLVLELADQYLRGPLPLRDQKSILGVVREYTAARVAGSASDFRSPFS